MACRTFPGSSGSVEIGPALEELTKGAVVRGLFGDCRLRIVDVTWHGSAAITLTYTDELTGCPGQELLYRDDEPRLTIEQTGRAWSMDGNGEHFRLASEAQFAL